MLQLLVRPYRRPEDNLLATGANVALTFTLLGTLALTTDGGQHAGGPSAAILAMLGASALSVICVAAGLVAGEVRAGACEVSSGSDFTAETVWGGAHGDVCTLRFEPPLETVPVVVVTATSYGKCYSRDVTPSAATIKCQTDLLSSAPSDAFLGFTFVAAEPGLGVAPSPP